MPFVLQSENSTFDPAIREFAVTLVCENYIDFGAMFAAEKLGEDHDLKVSYERQRIILAENELTRDLPGKYVDTFAFPDGGFEARWKGVSIPYSVFDKDQRVTHAAITENKRLSAVLEHIKVEQDKAPPRKCRAGKQRTRYKPTGRRNTEGWRSKLAIRAKKKQAEAAKTAAE